MNILIIGASRGIGLEFVRQHAHAGDRVIATARSDEGLAKISALGARALCIDVALPSSVSQLAPLLSGETIDVAIYVAGVLPDRASATTPPTQAVFEEVMRTNVLGAMQSIPQIAPLVEEVCGKFAFISSQMGCINEVESSSSWTYRVSKAALNMAVQSARFDYPKAQFLALSPGWVQTDMGGSGAPLSVEDSVQQMRQTIAQVRPQDANVFWHPDGKKFKGW